MFPIIAEVVLAPWQVVFLSVLSLASLVVALYCLFFMVPLKSFMRQINTLGGGMQGVRAYVDGVRQEVEEHIDGLEQSLREELQQQGEELGSSIHSAAETAREARLKLQELDRSLQHVQSQLRENRSDVTCLSGEMQTMRNRHAALRNDFEALESKLEGEVQRNVRDSYQCLESTVLSALEALQDEMLRGMGAGGRSRKDGPARGHVGSGRAFHSSSATEARRQGSGKIIPAEPLFAEVERDQAGGGSPDELEVKPGSEQSAPAN